VWTDGGTNTPVTFTVFGENGQQVFTTTLSGFADGSNNGETAEDRFFGATYSGGISSIFMSNASGGMEVDHLQYGLAAAGSVPEPETYAMLLAGLGLIGICGTAQTKQARLTFCNPHANPASAGFSFAVAARYFSAKSRRQVRRYSP
jgi:hypothetical protein